MSWNEIRKQMRATVHETFTRPAWYTPASGGARVRISARRHTRQAIIGDLDREGYARTIEGVDRLVLLASEVAQHNISRGGTVTMIDTGESYRLETRDPETDDYSVAYQVLTI